MNEVEKRKCWRRERLTAQEHGMSETFWVKVDAITHTHTHEAHEYVKPEFIKPRSARSTRNKSPRPTSAEPGDGSWQHALKHTHKHFICPWARRRRLSHCRRFGEHLVRTKYSKWLVIWYRYSVTRLDARCCCWFWPYHSMSWIHFSVYRRLIELEYANGQRWSA